MHCQGADLLLLAAMPIVHKVSGMVSLKSAPGTNPRSLIAPGGRCAVQVTWSAAASATPMSTQASERLGYILVAYLWLRMARILVFGGVVCCMQGLLVFLLLFPQGTCASRLKPFNRNAFGQPVEYG